MEDPSMGGGLGPPPEMASAMAMAMPIGVVLAGGLSRRMGRDKASLAIGDGGGGASLARRAARTLSAVVPRVLVADRGRGLAPPWESVADGPGRGPVAGLLGAAREAPGRSLLALACDLPGVPAALLAALAAGSGDLVVPETARGVEPLAALYRPRALAALARRVAAGDFALHPLAEEQDLAVERLEADELARFGDPETMFANLNTPEDLERYLRQQGT